MNLPLELVDKILQYDGRIKYRKGEFVNVIHPRDLGFYRFILNPVLKKKRNMHIDIKRIINAYNENYNNVVTTATIERGNIGKNKFYFEFEFDTLPGRGICYDYYWNSYDFKISYFDYRNFNGINM